MPDTRSLRPDDHEAITRMWIECGWIEDSDEQKEMVGWFTSIGDSLVADIDGEAECLVHRTPGTLWHGDHDLAFSGITAVTTSHVGRRLGLASTLMSESLAAAAADGAAVSGLGMFEQGYYDRFGFAIGAYDHMFSFDPGDLRVEAPYRPPSRVTTDDWRNVHAALAGRMRNHGGIVLDPPELMRAELAWLEKPWGLGYRDDEGRLTHCLLGEARDEHGPYTVEVIAYQNTDQLLELLRLLVELSDQVNTVRMLEPPHLRLQDIIDRPIRSRRRSTKSDHEAGNRAFAWAQFRILDLAACIGTLHTAGAEVDFNLSLRDPAADRTGPWAGIGGDYRVHLGPESAVEPGRSDDLPTLHVGVGPLTQWWLGARTASGVAAAGGCKGPDELIGRIDAALHIPEPHPTWDF